MVVRTVARFVVGLHVAGTCNVSAGGSRRVVLVDVVRHALVVGSKVSCHSPSVARRCVKYRECGGVGDGCKSGLVGVHPREQTVGRCPSAHVLRHVYFKVFGVGYETAAVAPSACAEGKGNHVAPLELERPYIVVEVVRGECLHETARTAFGVVCARISLETVLGVAHEWVEVSASVGEDDRSVAVHAYLTVGAVHRLLPVDIYV